MQRNAKRWNEYYRVIKNPIILTSNKTYNKAKCLTKFRIINTGYSKIFNLKSTNRNINVLYSIKMKIESKLRRLCHLVSRVCFKILWCIWKYEYVVFLNENLEKGFDNMATIDFSLFFAIARFPIIIISIQKKLIIRYFILQTENWSHLNSCFDSTDTLPYERMNNFLFLNFIFLRDIEWKWKYHY